MKSSRKHVCGAIAVIMTVGTVAAAAVASPLAAASEAGKKPLSIDVTGQGGASGSATFTLIGAGTAGSDSGTVTYAFSFSSSGKNPQGQAGESVRGTETLKGKRGGFVVHSSGRTYYTGHYEVWTGRWSIVSGTGEYAGLKGGGGFDTVIVHPELRFSIRYEGFATRS